MEEFWKAAYELQALQRQGAEMLLEFATQLAEVQNNG